jgi:RHS repeat-associated protein
VGLNKNNRNKGVQAMLYRYDQLHRIVQSRSMTSFNENGFTPRSQNTEAYDENYSYDANGNLLTLKRHDDEAALKDDFTYEYYANTNRLRKVKAVAGDTYEYDAIGNLIKDNEQGTAISWTPYGKVHEVNKGDSVLISFRYDPSGNRVEKKVTKQTSVVTTHYVRDASGNVMGVYSDTDLIEQPIYGSSRVGQYRTGRRPAQRTLGHKHYEMSNHLGNVLAVITDNIYMNTDSTWAHVVNVNDYYPFGLDMPGRSVREKGYRYGFNGKEKDDNGEFGNTTYDYGFRIYNPSIGRFLSVDPLTREYPFYTPYQFAGNKPIANIDLDGLEDHYAADGNVIGVGPLSGATRLQLHISYANKVNYYKQAGVNVNDHTSKTIERGGSSITVKRTNIAGGYKANTLTLAKTVEQSYVTDHSAFVLSDMLEKSNNDKAQISSAYRPPKEQARVMYDNIQSKGVEYNYNLYQWAGDKVIDTYVNFSPEYNCTKAECIDAMTQTIEKVGPGNVSKHSSNPQEYNVLDIAPSSIKDNSSFKEVLKQNSQNYNGGSSAPIKKYVAPPVDPAHHVEIQQPKKK